MSYYAQRYSVYLCKVSICLWMQVSEILTEDKTRLSVNGWFHGPIVPRPDRYVESPLPLKPYVEIEVKWCLYITYTMYTEQWFRDTCTLVQDFSIKCASYFNKFMQIKGCLCMKNVLIIYCIMNSWFVRQESIFCDWINPIYLDPEVQGQIQERFETDSEIELQGFLKVVAFSAFDWVLFSTFYWENCSKLIDIHETIFKCKNDCTGSLYINTIQLMLSDKMNFIYFFRRRNIMPW